MATVFVRFTELWFRANTGVVTNYITKPTVIECELVTAEVRGATSGSWTTRTFFIVPYITGVGSAEGIYYADDLHYGSGACFRLPSGLWYDAAANIATQNWNISVSPSGGTTKGESVSVYEYRNTAGFGWKATFSLTWQETHQIVVASPENTSIDYALYFNNAKLDEGTVSSAGTKTLSFSRSNTETIPHVLVLSIPDAKYSTDTFQGWTKNGTVIDRWSNPATIVASEAATYSCSIGSTPSTSPNAGQLLYDRYGKLLYAGDPSTSTHTINVTATFAETQHIIDYDICGEENYVEITGTTFSKSVTLSDTRFSNSSGALLYADKVLSVKPFLAKVFFHCQVPEHMYSVVIKVDGTTVYSENYLSGTFSKTFEIT